MLGANNILNSFLSISRGLALVNITKEIKLINLFDILIFAKLFNTDPACLDPILKRFGAIPGKRAVAPGQLADCKNRLKCSNEETPVTDINTDNTKTSNLAASVSSSTGIYFLKSLS